MTHNHTLTQRRRDQLKDKTESSDSFSQGFQDIDNGKIGESRGTES